MKTNDCDQRKCGFLQMGIGCRHCDTCGAEPYLINEHCDRCWNCKSDEGILRWEDGKGTPDDIKEIKKEKDIQNEKPIEIKN